MPFEKLGVVNEEIVVSGKEFSSPRELCFSHPPFSSFPATSSQNATVLSTFGGGATGTKAETTGSSSAGDPPREPSLPEREREREAAATAEGTAPAAAALPPSPETEPSLRSAEDLSAARSWNCCCSCSCCC